MGGCFEIVGIRYAIRARPESWDKVKNGRG